MRIILKTVLLTLSLFFLWAIFIVFGTLSGWWHQPLTDSDKPDDFIEEAKKEIHSAFVGSIVMALIEDGVVYDEYLFSIDKSVDRNTAFQAASLSKWVTAWGVMSLVDKGKLNLDEPINKYLTRWQLPKGEFNNNEVTIRLLLSHTAGLTDGLGYAGFLPETPIQSLEESLTRASDASHGDGEVKVGIKPSSEWKYSGGGYTLLQLLIEEVSEKFFQDYMTEAIFQPLGMINSTFVWDDSIHSNLAIFYNKDASIAKHYRYTSLAATSLYTSLNDMELFVQAHFEGVNKEAKGRGVLTVNTLDEMKKPHAYQMGAAIWGLGTTLYAENNQNDYIIGHDGKNEPAINTAVRLNPSTGNGIIILEMGNPLLATEIGSEWVFWKTGNIDTLLFILLIRPMKIWIGIGWLVILLFVVVIKMLKRK
ncbi:beta-lactamase family protein [Olleya sp. AH-315-F22]|nr:beta-lactamase family protein [Olleya sp. AH-315-F22]